MSIAVLSVNFIGNTDTELAVACDAVEELHNPIETGGVSGRNTAQGYRLSSRGKLREQVVVYLSQSSPLMKSADDELHIGPVGRLSVREDSVVDLREPRCFVFP